jgi:RNA polymerase sigma factor (sigma-70 family)
MSSPGGFPTTRVSALEGAWSDDEPVRRRSWEALVAAYWKPAYKHVRVRWRKSPEDAADRVQSFFERAVEKELWTGYDVGRARFRTFFRVCLDRFVSNEERAARREKRGGGARPLDFDAAEDELARAGAVASPEDAFDREWRRQLFQLAIADLEAECSARGKRACWDAFARYDLADGERPTYEELGRELGLPATTITNHLAFARRELKRLVLARLEEITASPEELREEARLLLEDG